MTKNDKFGEAYFTQMIRSLAVQCKFKDAEKYTMRSTRRTMLTKMVKGGVDNATLIKSGRHKDASTNALYIEENEEAHVRRGEALQYNPKASSKKKKKRKKDRSSSTSAVAPAFASMPQFPVAMAPHMQQAMQQAMAQAAQATMAQFMPNMGMFGNPGMGMLGGNYLQGIMAQGASISVAASKRSKSRDDSSDSDDDGSSSSESSDDDSNESSSDEDSASDGEATSSDEGVSDDED